MGFIINSYNEQIFYHYILNDGQMTQLTKPEFFNSAPLKSLFEIAKKYVVKYKEAPSEDQMKELVSLEGKSEILSEDIIHTVYNCKDSLNQYEKGWLDENSKAWAELRNLDVSLRKVISYIKSSDIKVENASDFVLRIKQMFTTDTNINFDFNEGSDFFNADSHSQKTLERHSTGYDYLDRCTKGGWWKGSLHVFLAPPKAGKSTVLCNLCANSVKNGHNSLYITLELQKEIVTARIGSNLLGIPIDDYETSAEDHSLIKTRLNNLKLNSAVPLGNLIIQNFPTSSVSVPDIENYILKTEEIKGIKFKDLYIDYINILKDWKNPHSENLYLKIKNISEDLRAIAEKNEWTIITATQANRSGWDSTDLNMNSTSESAALIATVDMLYGIINPPEYKTQGFCYIKCIADRVVRMDNTRKKFIMNETYLRMIEDTASSIEETDQFIPDQNKNNFKNKRDFNSASLINTQNTADDNSPTTKVNITAEDLF